MKRERIAFLTILVVLNFSVLLFLSNSCQHESIQADQIEQICFTEQILPIFQNSCATSGCHDNKGAGGYVFTDYAQIMKGIHAGDADKSKAYRAITSTLELMPPGNPLPQEKRTLIRLWIEQGANETSCPPTSSVGSPTGQNTKSGTLWACYERDIQPILNSSCAVSKCHDAITHKEGVDFSNYTKTLQQISKGNPEKSELYKAITASPGSEHFMPPKPYSPLSKSVIDTLYSWIKRGGLNEECMEMCDTTGTINYLGHLKPLVDRYCVSCHGATNPNGGIKLLTASDLKTVAQSGKLLNSLKRVSKTTAMPPTYALSTCEITQFELWTKQGYN